MRRDWFKTKAGKAWAAQRSRRAAMSEAFEDAYKRIAMLMSAKILSLAECRKAQRKHVAWSRMQMPAGRHATYSVLVELLSFEDGEASTLRQRSENHPLEFRHITTRTGKRERQVRRDLAWLKQNGWIVSDTTEVGHHRNSRSRYSFPKLADALEASAGKPAKSAPADQHEVSSKTPHMAESEVSSKTPIINTGSVEDREYGAAFRKASGTTPVVSQKAPVEGQKEATARFARSAPVGREEGSAGETAGEPLSSSSTPKAAVRPTGRVVPAAVLPGGDPGSDCWVTLGGQRLKSAAPRVWRPPPLPDAPRQWKGARWRRA